MNSKICFHLKFKLFKKMPKTKAYALEDSLGVYYNICNKSEEVLLYDGPEK